MEQPLVTVIMAAGKGTRMNSDLAKVLHRLNDRPMVHYVIELAQRIGSERIILIIGHQRKLVQEICRDLPVDFTVQDKQLGTGHAVMVTEPLLTDYDGDILILSGDVPLLTESTIRSLLNKHQREKATATLLTAEIADPAGYGRVIRDDQQLLRKIVEHKDAAPEELKVREINVGIYIFRARPLFEALKKIKNDNRQGEYYLPDVIPLLLADGRKVVPLKTADFDETRGINTVEQLKQAETILKNRS